MNWRFVLSLCIASQATAQDNYGANLMVPAPRPNQTADSIAPNLAEFSGIWQGKWEGTLDVVFALQKATASECKAYVSWGENALVHAAGETVTLCQEVAGELVIWMGDHNMIVLEPDAENTLFGLFYTQDADRPYRVVLRPLTDLKVDEKR